MFKSVDELNKEFYALYGDFVENKDSMPAEQRDVMSKTLLKRYKRAYKLLEMREELEVAREEYELNLRMDQFIPRTWRFLFFRRRYNRAAELSGAVLTPVAKCGGLGLLTRLCADFCRDGGSSTTATAVELVGCVCALLAASPLMLMLLELIGGWI